MLTGTVWEVGPWPRTLWVTADGEVRPSLVTLPTPGKAERGAVAMESAGSADRAARVTERAESLRRHGEVFAVSHGKRVINGHHHYSRESEVSCLTCRYPEHIRTFHADRGCSAIDGRPLAPDHCQGVYGAHTMAMSTFAYVLGVVLGVYQDWRGPSELCARCIWLQPASAEVAA